MAVTAPTAFQRLSLGPAGPFSHGESVGPSVDDLLANHNLMYCGQGTVVGKGSYTPGWKANGNWDLLFRRPADPDQRTLTCSVYAANTNASAQTIRIHDGSTTADISVPNGGPAWASVSWTPDSTSQGPVIVQVQDGTTNPTTPEITVYDVIIHRQVLTGSLSDSPLSSGWRWAQATAESTAEEPLSVELLNRMLAGPRQIQLAQPTGVYSLVDSPQQGRFALEDSASEATLLAGSAEEGEGPHQWILGGMQYPFDARVWVAARQRFGTVDGTVSINFAGRGAVLTFTGGTTTPTSPGPYQWQSADFNDLPAGMFSGSISIRGAAVFAVHILAR